MKIKELRILSRSKPEELAKMLNISVQAYYKYENGKNEPNIENLRKLADFYNVSLDYLCDRKWNNKIGYIPDDRIDLIKTIADLSDKDFNQINNYIKGYLDGKKIGEQVDFYTNDEKVENRHYGER